VALKKKGKAVLKKMKARYGGKTGAVPFPPKGAKGPKAAKAAKPKGKAKGKGKLKDIV